MQLIADHEKLQSIMSSSKINILTILIASIFILCAHIIILNTPPAAGYEISLYKAYPYYLWIFILAAFSCGLGLLVYNSFSNESSNWWIFGLIIPVYTNLLILLLPFIRGYTTLGRHDVLTHIGYIMDILHTGHFPFNHYPVVHIIGADLSYLTGLRPELLAEIFPGLFTLFYIVSIHLLARNIAFRWGETLLITAFGSLMLFKHANLMIAPSAICFLLLPFNLFLINRRLSSYKGLEFSIILILMLLMIPFLHPGEGTIFLFLIILWLEISRWLYLESNQRLGNDSSKVCASQSLGIANPELIMIITWFVWFSSYYAFARTIKSIWSWLVNEMGTTTAMEYTAIISKANLTLPEIIQLSFNMYGQALMYFITGIAVIIVFLKRLFSNNGKINQMQFTYSLLFIIFGALMLVAFLSKAIWVEYNRVMIYVIFAATILNGLGLYDIFHSRHKKIGMACIMIVLVTSATFGLFNTFPSPNVRESNSQVTAMEVLGMRHFLDHNYADLLIDNLGVNQMRFANCIRGVQNTPKNIRYLGTNPFDHFGYEINESYGQSYTEDRYFLESKLSRISYPEIFPDYKHLWRFTPEDFYHLDNSDTSASRIYCNGEFWTYYIKGCKKSSLSR